MKWSCKAAPLEKSANRLTVAIDCLLLPVRVEKPSVKTAHATTAAIAQTNASTNRTAKRMTIFDCLLKVTLYDVIKEKSDGKDSRRTIGME